MTDETATAEQREGGRLMERCPRCRKPMIISISGYCLRCWEKVRDGEEDDDA